MLYRVSDDKPIAVSLLEHNIHILSKSIKYHRPRGFFCLEGQCSSCLVRVNGVPNILACKTYPAEGMIIERQQSFTKFSDLSTKVLNYLPSSLLNHHNMFTSHKTLNKIFVRFIRTLGGLGKIGTKQGNKDGGLIEKKFDVAIIGGGNAGLSAFLTASKYTENICLIDENKKLGGHSNLTELTGQPDTSDSNVFLQAKAIGFYTNNTLLVNSNTKLLKISAKKFILATGTYQSPIIFKNNDLPYIISLDAAKKMFFNYGFLPSNNIAIIGATSDAFEFAKKIREQNYKIKGIIDSNDIDYTTDEFPLYENTKVIKALGKDRVFKLILDKFDKKKEISCDLLLINSKPIPNLALYNQAALNFSKKFKLMRDDSFKSELPNIYIIGSMMGVRNKAKSIYEGKIAALSCLFELTHSKEVEQERKEVINQNMFGAKNEIHNMQM